MNAFFEQLRHPIIQAPMAGGISTPELVAAVSNAGGLGSLGAAYMSPAEIATAIAEIRRRTDRPFNVNLFAGGRDSRAVDTAPILRVLAEHHAALGLAPPALPDEPADLFDAQATVVLEAKVSVFSFTFGIPSPAWLARFKAQGALTVGTATTVEEAKLLRAAGVDAIATQGCEAGAHRGTFAGPFEHAMIGTLALVPQIVDAVPGVPVIASGGIMDGRGIVAALALGAVAAQMGTAFLGCPEAGITEVHKRALASTPENRTVVTRAFSGRPARAISNRFVEDAERVPIPGFPLHNTLMRPLRAAAAKKGDAERIALWAGQGLRLTRRLPAAELVERLAAEVEETRARLAGRSMR